MKKIKVLALCAAVMMLLPLIVSCGSAKSGTPNTFSNVTVVVRYDPAAEEEVEDVLYQGEVVVYADDASSITLLDVIRAYCDDKNVGYYYDEAKNMITKIDEYSAGNGVYWLYTVDGADAKLSQTVKTDSAIEIFYSK